ncbi:MAG: hypothetical protein ACR2JC_15130 [Chloroflexota bacterium]|nr:MAG: hypothetical protein DLM70_04015 [Chloroflexota bacterium]
MSTLARQSAIAELEERLTRGADVLFDMEQRGDRGSRYEEWLRRWTILLDEYEERVGWVEGERSEVA